MIHVPYYSHPNTRNDEWVISHLQEMGCSKDGYYVEAGAFDGITHSNTLTLERHFNWTGLLIEPHPDLVSVVKENRPNNIHSDKALSLTGLSKRGTLLLGGQWSGLQELMTRKFLDQHQERGNPGVEVECATLHEVLEAAKAPQHIDYLSLDIEGGELPVLLDYFLKTPDDVRRRFGCITVEYEYDESILQCLIMLLDHFDYRFVKLSGWDAFFIWTGFRGQEKVT